MSEPTRASRHPSRVENSPPAPTSAMNRCPARAPERKERCDEVPAADLREPGNPGDLLRRPEPHGPGRRHRQRAHGVRRAGRRRGARRSVPGQGGPRRRRRSGGDRRPVRRGQGAPRRLHDRRGRERGARARHRHALPAHRHRRDGGAPAHGPVRDGDVRTALRVEDLLRELAPRVLGALVRRYGRFDACEDAVQEALLAAAMQWPQEGVPDNPHGWLTTVAARRLSDQWRSDSARRNREATAATLEPPGTVVAPENDDTLTLLFLCCHPALSPPSQIALTLRAVGGLTTAEIASAFLIPEATMAQRISRAKQSIKSSGGQFTLPPADERAERLRVVLHVLYLIFNEGYTASSGPALQRAELTAEAIRLTRMLHQLMPREGEVAGLLALMLLTDARRAARTASDGSVVPLAEQDRTLWDSEAIAEGVALVTDTLSRGPIGPYQIQAAIAAVHDEAPTAEVTDWPQILALYTVLERVAPNPTVTLNRAVAVAKVRGPAAGLALLDALSDDERISTSPNLVSVRAHLLEMAGDHDAARASYQEAARRTTSEH